MQASRQKKDKIEEFQGQSSQFVIQNESSVRKKTSST